MTNRTPYNFVFGEDRTPIFIGREQELESLNSAILDKKHSVIAITGNNATGKSLLWMHFLRTQGIELANNTEVISIHRSSDSFPKLNKNTRLVVVEDLSLDFSREIFGRISSLMTEGSERQFILVSAFPEFVGKFNPETHIHLHALPHSGSQQFLLSALEQILPDQDLAKISAFTQGNPLLLHLVANHINRGERDIDKLFRLLGDEIRYRSTAVVDSSIETPQLIQVATDIRLVNGRLLDVIQKNHRAIYDLTPRQFEEFVAELMEKRGYRVDLTKATRDGGKDLIVANHHDIGNFIFYIECKKYAPSNPVGVNLVRELAGTVLADRVTAGIMVTSSYFSPDAVIFSSQLKHQLSLVDFLKLKDWINETHNTH